MNKSQRQRRSEGEDLGGTQLRSRMEQRENEKRAKDIQSRTMAAGHEPNFRDRPEITAMRNRAARWKSYQ